MAKTKSWSPIAFCPAQVTTISSIVYIALFAVLIWVHTSVPSAPRDSTPVSGINLTEAWLDLSYISDGYHPVDSRRNELVRQYLVTRIGEILEKNEMGYKVIKSTERGTISTQKGNVNGSQPVTVFVDNLSNVTYVDDWRMQPWTCYGESTNVMVYVRGADDEDDDWWDTGKKYDGQSGVLVNAHYDSVSSGFGATDDGVGVVTVLQLVSYFTTEGNQPRRGAVFLFNNAEENGLYGAHNFLRHPLSQFTHTFLNLEGAGAGGRATLFRSTDAEVTKFYSQSPYPFGAVVSGDGFKRGFIRSGTDYSVFNNDNGMRGLDVAFFEPRARYHTDQDDARNTSPDSLWHMLSSALATMKAMTSFAGDEFEGSIESTGKVDIGTGTDGVWFDLFGRAFAVMKLPSLFVLSVTLLAAGPLIFIILEIIITKNDKWYPLSKRKYLHSEDDDEAVHFNGMRGLLRLPIAFILSTAAVLALAYLVAKINPYIVSSSEYPVWIMMLSAWFVVAWFFLAGADRVRPTALQRMYSLIWLYAFTWIFLVLATVGENNFQIASGYCVVIYNASVFVALLISYLELFGLPKKTAYVEHVANAEEENENHPNRRPSESSRGRLNESHAQPSGAREEEEPTERTSLLRSTARRSGDTFKKFVKRRQTDDDDNALDDTDDKLLNRAYGDEQAWSSSLPQWTWIIQLIVLAPINIIIIGQISLLLSAALRQTPADGSPVLPIYLFFATFTTMLLLPLTPFLHRYSYKVANFVFLIFIGCLIYNLLAFPFSRDARLKVFFVQEIDLHSGANNVTLTGLDGFLQDMIGELPSAAGQNLHCGGHSTGRASGARTGLQSCAWNGLMPNVLADDQNTKAGNYTTWLDFNTTRSGRSVQFSIRGRSSKQCLLAFDTPVSEVHIENAASDPRYKTVLDQGSKEVRLMSRDWDKIFKVNVTWPDSNAKGQQGRVVCMWSDANKRGIIPAYDEIRRFQPVWSAVTKTSDGLVEGFKEFTI